MPLQFIDENGDNQYATPTLDPSETILKLKEENTRLQQEDLINKEAIAELYILATGGF